MKIKKGRVILGGLALLGIIGVAMVVSWSHRPFSGQTMEEKKEQTPVLVIPTGQPLKITAEVLPTQVDLPTPLPLAAATSIPTAEPVGRPICSAPPVMLALALGVDENDQADAIRLIRADFVQRRVSVLAVPRDLWVRIPGLSEVGIENGRINAALGYGDYFWGAGNGILLMLRAFDENFDIEFDHYAQINFRSFIHVVDTLGGVDIYLDAPVDGTLQGMPYFAQGEQHLTGLNALYFVRIRFPDTDVHRTRRQTQVMKALFKKALLPENWVKIPGLIADIQKQAAVTDMTPAQMSMVLCLVSQLGDGDIIYYEIPAEYLQPYTTLEGGSVRLPLTGLDVYLQNFMNGTLPVP